MDNSVFISYRRDASNYFALAIYQDLTAHNVDTFYDIESINAGQFDTIILNQIAARAYFLLILTPGTLERCKNDGDWLQLEINEALRLRRMILPLHTPEFNFADIEKFLPTEVARELNRFNRVEIPHKHFRYAMQELRERYLKPITITIIPTSQADQQIIERKREQANAEPAITQYQLIAQAYFERGYARPNNDFDGKIADFSEAIRLDPRFVEAYINRGFARHKKGDFDGALADCNDAILLNPNYAMAYNNRGSIRGAKGDFEGAIEDWNRAIRLNPELADAYSNRGAARGANGDFDGGIEDCNVAIRLNSKSAEAYNNRGFVHHKKGDFDGGIDDYGEALRLNPELVTAYSNRSSARGAKGDLDGAIEDCNEAIRLNPKFAGAYNNRGFARYHKGDLDGAIEDCNEAIRLNPELADAYSSRGCARQAKGDVDGAIADYEKALELNPNDPLAKLMREYIAKHKK